MDQILNYLQLIVVGAGAIGAIFGVARWVFSLNKNIKEILKEVKPNSGTSLNDKVNNIEKQVKKDSQLINTICSRQKWLLDNRPEPIFECDVSGSCTWVNEKYCQLLQHDVEYFTGNGWKNGVHTDDRERVSVEWDRALKDKRSSVIEYRLVDREGHVFKVKATAIRNDDQGYIGSITILE